MEFDTLSNYTTIAKKTISKFGSKMYPGLVKEMLSNDETVYEIAEAIMMADWNWDKDRKGQKSGQGKNLYSYRNQCAIWAIKTYVTQKYKKNKKHKKQMDYLIENSEYVDYNKLLSRFIGGSDVSSLNFSVIQFLFQTINFLV